MMDIETLNFLPIMPEALLALMGMVSFRRRARGVPSA